MKLLDLKIGTRLKIAFWIMTLLTAGLGGICLYQVHQVASLTQKLYDHPYTVTKAMTDIRAAVRATYVLSQELDPGLDPGRFEEIVRELDRNHATASQKYPIIHERFLGDMDDVNAAEEAMSKGMESMATLIRAHRGKASPETIVSLRQAAAEDLRDAIKKTYVMINFAEGKAKAFMASAAEAERNASLLILVMLAAVTVTGLLLARTITNSIASPLVGIVGRLRNIAQGNLGSDISAGELDGDRSDEVGELIDSFRGMRASQQAKIEQAAAIAAGDFSVAGTVAGETDALGHALNAMSESLRTSQEMREANDWVKTGHNELAAKIAGEKTPRELGETIISFLTPYLGAQIGSIYTLVDEETLVLSGGYAFTKRKGLSDVFHMGEGLVGQAAHEGQIISVTDIPEDYIRINSSFGDAQPRNIVLVPFHHEGAVMGVMEFGAFEEFSDTKLELLRSIDWTIGVAFHSAASRAQLKSLLEQTMMQSDKLRTQQEELKATNEELEQQAAVLQASEEELRVQQEELQAANEELAEKNDFLEQQRNEIASKNRKLEVIGQGLEQKAKELEVSSRYKSEFLANMSHELRTPLNSLLLLSRNLMDNGQGNLTPDQVEFAKVIHKSGNDLLALISDILDLSKIEAGKMTISLEKVTPRELADSLDQLRPMCREKGLTLDFSLDADLPEELTTDRQRVEQVLRNLMSNAIKFTESGGISVHVFRPSDSVDLSRSGLKHAAAIAISVADTGIGIAPEKHLEIFEAFQQADGGTARKYGGTGLGLSISREIARLLGGEIQLASELGKGSCFTLYLPLEAPEGIEDLERASTTLPRRRAEDKVVTRAPLAPAQPGPQVESIPDDRDIIAAGEHSVLIVEDDPVFAKILLDQAHAKGLRGLVAATGEEGLLLAARHAPGSIILDIKLPGISGWDVLDELKRNPELRHIPVHVMSGLENSGEAQKKGAIGYLRKPASRENLEQAFQSLETVMQKRIKDLLLIEDEPGMRKGIISLVGDMDVHIREVATGADAIKALQEKDYDCVILDLGLPDMTGFELLERLQQDSTLALPPVIVYTGRELTKEEESGLRGLADSIIIKGVKSEERLLDETALFLHQMIRKLPPKKLETIVNLHDKDALLRGKTVLLVDDDMRNLFALSQVLGQKGMTVIKAEDGQKALDMLEKTPDMDLVILDIMMPVLDGYETARRIRAQRRFEKLPIIALTAKAMREDREKCIQAGASDYLAKPVDVDRLMSMMRVWLSK